MKEFVSEKNQLDKIKQFKGILSGGGLGLALVGVSFGLHQNIETMKNIAIEGKNITKYEIYKTHFSIFKEIAEKTINRFDLLGAFGFPDDEIFELKSKNPDKKKVSQILFDRLGIVVNEKVKDIEKKEVELLKNLSNRVTPEVNKKMVESMYFSNIEINRILNGVTDYLKIDLKNKSSKDQELKEYLSLKLYADAFEIYLKVLKEIYSKFKKVKIKKIQNDKMYSFFNDKYPLLLDSTNNKLRNDVCHLKYKERGDYTLEQIDEERNIILVKALTGIIVRNIFIVDFFDESAKIEKREEDFFDDIFKIVNEVVGNIDKEETEKQINKGELNRFKNEK